MSTPHDDLQRLYQDASAMQDDQPAPTVRAAVLAHAAMLAQSRAGKGAEVTPAPRRAANWPHWKSGLVASVLLVPLLGMLMLHMKDTPEWQEPIPAPGRADVATTSKPAAVVAPAVPPAPAVRSEAAIADAATGTTHKVARATREAAPAAKVTEATPPTPAPASAGPHTPAAVPLPALAASVADAAPAPVPARPAQQAHVAAASADRAQGSENRMRESSPVVSSFAASPPPASASAAAPAKAMAGARSAPTSLSSELLRAAEQGNLQQVQALLNAGASLQARDAQGRTALMWAAIGGHTVLVQRLLELGADRSATDRQGWTALQHAQQAGQQDAAALLE